jgi:phenylpropionate dioxygenase-like ring-hydroxylating dioxygenase large terminal subunit
MAFTLATVTRGTAPVAAAEPTRYLLPPEAYTDATWYEREQRELFGRTWNLVAYEEDVAGPGDYLPVQAGPDPVLLVRGHDGELRAFVNMCRHRGMALACTAGHTDGNVRCPYHGWEFSPAGALERIPQRAAQFPDIDTEQWGLVPLAVGTWSGMVFVNPDPAAAPFAEWLGDLPDRFGPFDTSQLVEVFRLQVPLACNWKLYIENHVDVLHLWYLHDESLGMYDHTGFVHDHVGPHWVSEERLRHDAERDRGLAPIAHLPDDERDVLRANLIFPNVPTSSSETQWMTYQVVPTGPGTSMLDIRIRGERGSPPMGDADIAQLLRVLRDEDGGAVEQIQRVLRSPRFQVGPLASSHEAPITRFQRNVLEHLT